MTYNERALCPLSLLGGENMKCKVLKRVWCPLRKGYITPGEVIEVPEKYIKGYKPYVQVIETAKKEPETKKTTKKSGDK